jgi:MYXO-CTERM domain-containing protein
MIKIVQKKGRFVKIHTLKSLYILATMAIPAALALSAAPADAQLTLGTSPTSAVAGGSGAFDITLTDVAGSFNVAGFTFGISVAPSSGVTFTGADMNTAARYIFFGNSLDDIFSQPLSTSTFPTTDVNAFDVAFIGGTTVSAGDVFALGDISYAVAPGTAPGPVTVDFVGVGSFTSLSDSSGNAVAFTTNDGTIEVNSSLASTPEPGAYAIFASLGLAGVTFLRRRRHESNCV